MAGIAIAASVVLAAGIGAWVSTAPGTWASAPPAAAAGAPAPGPGTCGPWSLTQVLLRLDPTADPLVEGTCAELPVGPRGTSFAQLATAARSLGFAAELERLDPQRPPDALAVLWVDGDHFVVSEPGPDPGVAIIRDQHAPPLRSDDPRWRGRWRGETLRLRARPVAAHAPRWDRTILDLGEQVAGGMLEGRFTVQAAPGTRIEVDAVQPGCSCSGYALPQRISATGATLAVSVRVDTAGRRGAQATSLEVLGRIIADDGRTLPWRSRLWFQSWLVSNRVVGLDAMHVGPLRSDQATPVEVPLLAARLDPAVVRAVTWHGDADRVSATWAAGVRGPGPIAPEAIGDRVLRLALRANPGATAGAWTIRADVAMDDGRRGELRLSGSIVPRWTTMPESAILRRGATQAVIRAQATYGQRLRLLDPVWIDADGVAERCRVVVEDGAVRLTIIAPAVRPGVASGRLRLACADEDAVEVPVILLPGSGP